MLDLVVDIAKKAGEKILRFYNSELYTTECKEDGSPLTKADIEANEYITAELGRISDYPVVSEECMIEYRERQAFNFFWLVDPLDGTKDFIAKNGHFTTNIALLEENRPILGVIHAPALGLTYYAKKTRGAFLNGKKIFNTSERKQLIAADSLFHSSKKTTDFLSVNGIKKVYKYGSALKFGKLAEGIVDVYPRLNGSKEWDTAAGHILLREAGCEIIDLETKQEIAYNKECQKNNYFVALKKDLRNQLKYSF